MAGYELVGVTVNEYTGRANAWTLWLRSDQSKDPHSVPGWKRSAQLARFEAPYPDDRIVPYLRRLGVNPMLVDDWVSQLQKMLGTWVADAQPAVCYFPSGSDSLGSAFALIFLISEHESAQSANEVERRVVRLFLKYEPVESEAA